MHVTLPSLRRRRRDAVTSRDYAQPSARIVSISHSLYAVRIAFIGRALAPAGSGVSTNARRPARITASRNA